MLIATSAMSFISGLGVALAIVALIGGSYFVLKARKGTADDNEAVKTATLMTGQIAALTSARELDAAEMRRQDAEIAHLHALRAEDAKTADRNKVDIQRLTELVTQQAAVEQFRAEAFAWFEAIAKKIDADPPTFPDHIPEAAEAAAKFSPLTSPKG